MLSHFQHYPCTFGAESSRTHFVLPPVTLVLAFISRQSGAELFVQSLQLVVIFDTWSVARQWRPHDVINTSVYCERLDVQNDK